MIKVENLVKQYDDKYAVNDVSFTVGDGEIVGLLGPNGAGKSTIMNIITGYLSSTSGNVSVEGFDILEFATEAKKSIGYLPEVPPLYPDMTVIEYLNFVYSLKNCTFNRTKHLDEICEVVKIANVKNRLIDNLSKGYKQRVGIAQALVGNPKVIILDEPTVGLDPKQIVEIRNLIRTLGQNHSVILSTHILSEVQSVCDRVVIINNGKLVADERTEDISTIVGGNRRVSVKICGPSEQVNSAIRNLHGVQRVEILSEHELESSSYIIESAPGIDIRKPLFKLLAHNDWPLIESKAIGISLEDIFISMTDRSSQTAKKKIKRIKVIKNNQSSAG